VRPGPVAPFPGIRGQIATLGIAFQQPLALQATPNALTCTDALVSRAQDAQERLKSSGRYLLRTNLASSDPAELWRYYIQLV